MGIGIPQFGPSSRTQHIGRCASTKIRSPDLKKSLPQFKILKAGYVGDSTGEYSGGCLGGV